MNPKLVISSYFDSLINIIDIYTEEELEKNKETDFVAIDKPFEFDKDLKFYFNKYDFSHQPSNDLPHGSVRVKDYLNETREKLIAVVNLALGESLKRCEEIKDELIKIGKDGRKTNEEREEEVKRKVFANKFLGLVRIDRIDELSRMPKKINIQWPFKLYLVELDYFMDQSEQLLLRYFFFGYA